MASGRISSVLENLSGVHEVCGVERTLDSAHCVHCSGSVLLCFFKQEESGAGVGRWKEGLLMILDGRGEEVGI